MGLDTIAQIVTTKSALIALIILACIIGIQAGFIGGLISMAGSLKKLLRLTSSNNRTYNTSKKQSPTTK